MCHGHHTRFFIAFLSKFLKNLAFIISIHNFITYNTLFYNISYIKISIFLTLHLNILSLLFFIHFFLLFLTLPMSLSPTISPSFSTRSRSFFLSLIFCSQNLHGLSFSSSSPLITATATTTATTTNNNLNPQPPNKKKKTMAQTTAKTHDKTATKPTTLTTPI